MRLEVARPGGAFAILGASAIEVTVGRDKGRRAMTIASYPGNPPALVGRERELALLREYLSAALDGRGSLVLIGGEAGIGKTALAEALCREASEQGALVLVGRCFDLAETP